MGTRGERSTAGSLALSRGQAKSDARLAFRGCEEQEASLFTGRIHVEIMFCFGDGDDGGGSFRRTHGVGPDLP